jgi:hypothetical protein
MNFVSQNHIYFLNRFQISMDLCTSEVTQTTGCFHRWGKMTVVQTNKSRPTAYSLHIYEPNMSSLTNVRYSSHFLHSNVGDAMNMALYGPPFNQVPGSTHYCVIFQKPDAFLVHFHPSVQYYTCREGGGLYFHCRSDRHICTSLQQGPFQRDLRMAGKVT